jgi:uroporphyrinogen-III synthase
MKQSLPLAVLTRPAGLNETLAQRLEQSGWSVTIAPALQIEQRALHACEHAPNPSDYDLIIFVSANAVAGYASQLSHLYHWPASTRAACVGLTTAQSIRESFGDAIQVLHPAELDTQDSESLWRAITAAAKMPERVLILRGQDGRDWLAEQLMARGVSVQLHVAYCRERATWSAALQKQFSIWAKEDFQPVWLLTSPHGIESVMAQIKESGSLDWAARCRYIVTHARLVEVVRHQLGELSANTCIEISRGDLSSLASSFDKIRQHLHRN